MSEVTQILQAIQQGDQAASDRLLPMVYEELRRLAKAKLATEPAGHTLQPTALVHEAYLRLVDVNNPQAWNSKGHFFAAADCGGKFANLAKAGTIGYDDRMLASSFYHGVSANMREVSCH